MNAGFGLVNKQQQIRGVWKEEKDIPGPEHYKLQIHVQEVEPSTWMDMQKDTQAEVVDIEMKIPVETPKRKGTETLAMAANFKKRDERRGRILGYGNGRRSENVQDERKTLDDHQNEEDAARGDSVGVSDLL